MTAEEVNSSDTMIKYIIIEDIRRCDDDMICIRWLVWYFSRGGWSDCCDDNLLMGYWWWHFSDTIFDDDFVSLSTIWWSTCIVCWRYSGNAIAEPVCVILFSLFTLPLYLWYCCCFEKIKLLLAHLGVLFMVFCSSDDAVAEYCCDIPADVPLCGMMWWNAEARGLLPLTRVWSLLKWRHFCDMHTVIPFIDDWKWPLIFVILHCYIKPLLEKYKCICWNDLGIYIHYTISRYLFYLKYDDDEVPLKCRGCVSW